MQPLAFTTALADIRRDEQIAAATAGSAARVSDPPSQRPGDVTIRLSRPQDASALERLAQLDGRGDAPAGDAVLAVVDGEVVAARGLRGGVASDPFRAGHEILALLDVRARQLAGGRFPRRSRFASRAQGHARPVLRVGGAR